MRRLHARPVAVAAVIGTVVGCGAPGQDASGDAEHRGEVLFMQNCVACHGTLAAGTAAGPPLVHDIYEPGHHPDDAFQRAVTGGVAQHHWTFGPMPAIPGLDHREVEDIISYVRHLQREAGIID